MYVTVESKKWAHLWNDYQQERTSYFPGLLTSLSHQTLSPACHKVFLLFIITPQLIFKREDNYEILVLVVKGRVGRKSRKRNREDGCERFCERLSLSLSLLCFTEKGVACWSTLKIIQVHRLRPLFVLFFFVSFVVVNSLSFAFIDLIEETSPPSNHAVKLFILQTFSWLSLPLEWTWSFSSWFFFLIFKGILWEFLFLPCHSFTFTLVSFKLFLLSCDVSSSKRGKAKEWRKTKWKKRYCRESIEREEFSQKEYSFRWWWFRGQFWL